MLAVQFGEDGEQLVRPGRIAGEGLGAGLGGEIGEFRGIAGDQGQIVAGAAEAAGERGADAAACPDDECGGCHGRVFPRSFC